LLVFSTNLPPHKLVDEAFLRRIPYKIEVTDPAPREVPRPSATVVQPSRHRVSERRGRLSARQALPGKQPAASLLPSRDLVQQVLAFCEFQDLPLVLTPKPSTLPRRIISQGCN